MSQHIHASFKQIPPAVLALFKQQAITAERPTQAQLESIALQMQQNAVWTELANKGIVPPASTELVDTIVKRVQNSRFDADTENKGDRDAKRAARTNENGFLDWVVTELSEDFGSQREQTRMVHNKYGEQLFDVMDSIKSAFANGLFGVRFVGEQVTPADYTAHNDNWNLLALEVA